MIYMIYKLYYFQNYKRVKLLLKVQNCKNIKKI